MPPGGGLLPGGPWTRGRKAFEEVAGMLCFVSITPGEAARRQSGHLAPYSQSQNSEERERGKQVGARVVLNRASPSQSPGSEPIQTLDLCQIWKWQDSGDPARSLGDSYAC